MLSRFSSSIRTTSQKLSKFRIHHKAQSQRLIASFAQTNSKSTSLASLGGLALITAIFCQSMITSEAEPAKSHRIYRRHEVQEHNSMEKGVWVMYKDGVYDVTQFLENHPGGKDRLMQAAGKNIELFWKQHQFRFHNSSPLAHELLEELRIGTLHPDDIITEFGVSDEDHLTYPTNKIYDCVIVGSGLAGLQCAYSLVTDHNIDPANILILEAHDYVGGRVRQMDQFIKGCKIDVGPEFLHGSGTDLNKFAARTKEPVREIYCWAHGDGGPLQKPVYHKGVGGYGLYFFGDEKGRRRLLRYDDPDPQFTKLNEALWNMGELNEDNYSDHTSLGDYLNSIGLSKEMQELGQSGYSNTMCSNSRDVSLKQVIKWTRFWSQEQAEDGDYIFENSFRCVIDSLKEGLQIEMSSPVKEIITAPSDSESDLLSGLVKIKTNRGTTYYARTSVVTASPHVLRSGLMSFHPELPTGIQTALQTTDMHNIVKIIAKFSEPVWPRGLSGMIMADPEFLIPEMWFRTVEDTADADEPAKAYLVGFCTADRANKVMGMHKDDVLDMVLKQLEIVFQHAGREHMTAVLPEELKNKVQGVSTTPATAAELSEALKLKVAPKPGSNHDVLRVEDIPTPSSLPSPRKAFLGGMFWDWNPAHFPYIGGGYCAPKVGTRPWEAQEHLSTGIKSKGLFFAGEATNNPGGTAHAALESGNRAAAQVKENLSPASTIASDI